MSTLTIPPGRSPEIIRRVAADPTDREATEILYRDNRPLLRKYASIYSNYTNGKSVDFCDLEQAGFLGLVAAACRWDESRGAWSTVASVWIRSFVRLAAHDADLITLSRNVRHERPNDLDVRRAMAAPSPLPTDRGSDAVLAPEPETEPDEPDPRFDLLRAALDGLLPAERNTIARRYGFDGHEPMSFQDIAQELGISNTAVCANHKRGIARLRIYLDDPSKIPPPLPDFNVPAIRNLLDQFPPRDREVIILHHGLDGQDPLSFRQIARRRGLAATTVGTHYARVLDRLRECLVDPSRIPPHPISFDDPAVRAALDRLQARDQDMIRTHYGLNGDPPVPLAEMARLVGLPKSTVADRCRCAMRNLRNKIRKLREEVTDG